MMEDLRELMLEEIRFFIDKLILKTNIPTYDSVIITGELSAHILLKCNRCSLDLVICGNHNQRFFSKKVCCAETVVAASKIDVLLVPLR